MTSAAAPIPPEMWSQPAYVERQIALIEEALTGVLFGDYSVSVQTEPGAPIWGNLAMHINVVINAARNATAHIISQGVDDGRGSMPWDQP